MICAIMQPTYIPWLGYFDLIDQVDAFIFLDDVQLEKSSWQLRNRIKFQNSECYLPINRSKNKDLDNLQNINHVIINDSKNWRYKHIRTIQIAYSKAKFFNIVFPFIESLINQNTNKLSDFNINIITAIANKLSIKTKFFISSNIECKSENKIDRLLDICKYLESDLYISPKGSFEYLKEFSAFDIFKLNNIDILFQNYTHPTYNQLGNDFLPYMSILDLLFNYGFDASLDIIKSGRYEALNYNQLV